MIKKSYFGFDPPTDQTKWSEATNIAASGRQVFAEKISEVFRSPFDYIDGDVSFRNIEAIVDHFIDPKTMLSAISDGFVSTASSKRYAAQVLKHGKEDEMYIRRPYNLSFLDRSPILQIGAFRYSPSGKVQVVRGDAVRGPRQIDFLSEFKEAESKIRLPTIFMVSLNENWGWLSTHFPNRTARWGRQPKPSILPSLLQFLNSDKTVMMIINQHSNISHPKLLTLPRGVPLMWKHTSKVLFDALKWAIKNIRKTFLLTSIASPWGPRKEI